MRGIPVVEISEQEAEKVLAIEEGHFADLKAIDIAPAKLTQSVSGFSNAEGGELYIGIDETDNARSWRGFSDVEALLYSPIPFRSRWTIQNILRANSVSSLWAFPTSIGFSS